MSIDESPPKLAYTLPELQNATGLDGPSSTRRSRLALELTKVGRRSIVTDQHARAWLASFGNTSGPSRDVSPGRAAETGVPGNQAETDAAQPCP
jgi:hypothetical protein